MVLRREVAIGRHVVDELDAQHIAWLHAQSGPGHGAFVHPHVEPEAANILVAVSHAQNGVEHAICGAADLRLDEWRTGGEALSYPVDDRLVLMCRCRAGSRDEPGHQPCRSDAHSRAHDGAPRETTAR